MELKVRVRAMRKVVTKIEEDRSYAYEDMAMFGAPSECYRDVEKGLAKRIKNSLKALDLTEADYLDELDKYIAIEGKFSGEAVPPQAFFDSMF